MAELEQRIAPVLEHLQLKTPVTIDNYATLASLDFVAGQVLTMIEDPQGRDFTEDAHTTALTILAVGVEAFSVFSEVLASHVDPVSV